MESQSNKQNLVLNTSANISPTTEFKWTQLTDTTGFNKHFQQLTNEQKQFVYLLDKCFKTNTNSIVLVSGCPGAGKTFMVVETCFYLNMEILTLAPTNSLATQIRGMTIHSGLKLDWSDTSRLYSIEGCIDEMEIDQHYVENCLQLSEPIAKFELFCEWEPKIVIIDEVGMIPFWLTYQIIQYLNTHFSPVIIVMMGDKYQLRPVKCKLNIFNANMPNIRLETINLTGNKRFEKSFKIIIDRIMYLISEGEKIDNFDNVYDYIKNTFPKIDYMTETLLTQCHRILAYKNESVAKYNKQFLELNGSKIHIPKIENNIVLKNDFITLKPNCEIITTQRCTIPKGTKMKFLSYDARSDTISCLCDGDAVHLKRMNGQFPIKLAFACTIHKFQGSTIENNVIIDFDYSDDVYLMYTALSRVRSVSQIIGILHIK